MAKERQKKSKQATPKWKTTKFWVQLIWVGVLTAIIVAGLIFVIIAKTMLPDTTELENPTYELATKIISSDGEEIGKAYRLNREWLSYEELNPYLVKALVATEDERYFSHSGIDIRGLSRAVFYLGSRGGASTISQQLAKLFFTDRSSSFVKRVWQKLKEWVIAVEFERRYTKGEIIAMYLNKHGFIFESIGIGSAAKTYYGKDQKDLSIDEAAVLIGMLKNPYQINPKRNPELANKRKKVVLKQMVRNKFISEEKFKKLAAKPIVLDFKREAYKKGPAPYFNAELVKWVRSLLNQPDYAKPDGTKYNIYTDGLKIYTTIDSRMQEHAEKAKRKHMATLQERYFTVWGDKSPWTHNGYRKLDKETAKKREAQLQRDIRSSERFKMMRQSYIGEVSSQIIEEFPSARLTDNEIFRLFNAEEDKRYLKASVKRKLFTKDKAELYAAILESEHWPIIKRQWLKLRVAVEKSFDKKVKMKIYDYKNGGSKIVQMTPLDSIKYHQQILQIGSLALDAHTGAVKVWVGGVDHNYFQYDHVTSNRQVGSTFKPFIYSTAIIDQAMSPCRKFQDVKTCIPANDPYFKLTEKWCPDNSNEKFTQDWLNLSQALQKSTNSISAQLMKEIGNVERVRDLVANLGIDKDKIPPYPSICLGVPNLSTIDMAGAYTAYANNGTYSRPYFVTRIEDKDGKVIYEHVPYQKKAINPAYNHVIVKLLQDVAAPIRSNFNSKVAGKTGTTNDYRDGWFVGFTPELVISTWVGGEKEYVRFLSLGDGAGSKMARPYFVNLLKAIEKDSRLDYDVDARFDTPDEEIVELDCTKYDALFQPDKPSIDTLNEVLDDEF